MNASRDTYNTHFKPACENFGDNMFVGDDVIAGGATKIFTNAPKGRVLLGYPGVKMETHIEMQKALRRLPRFMRNNSK